MDRQRQAYAAYIGTGIMNAELVQFALNLRCQQAELWYRTLSRVVGIYCKS